MANLLPEITKKNTDKIEERKDEEKSGKQNQQSSKFKQSKRQLNKKLRRFRKPRCKYLTCIHSNAYT